MPESYFQSQHRADLAEEEVRAELTRQRSNSLRVNARHEIAKKSSFGKPFAGQPLQEKSGETSRTEQDDSNREQEDNAQMSQGGDTPTINDDDVLLVDWDGPDDPKNPKNWSYKRKWAATIIVSMFTFVSPLSSSMIAPASANAGQDLGITDTTVLAMSISIFILGYAVGPLFLGPLSEIFGRSIVLQLSNLFYLAWNTGCGFAQTKSQLIAFRFLAGLGGSAPLSIGGGVLGDIWNPEQRGQAIAIYSLAPLMGPVLGPVMGAWIAERTTWRWVFWSTSLYDVLVQVAGTLFLQETYAPILLERRAKQLRQDMDEEKSSYRRVRTMYENDDRTWQKIFKKSLIRPFVLFVHEPIVQLLGVYMAFIYGVLYLFLTTLPSIYEQKYGEPVGIAGLHYFALGIGLTGASQVNARFMDRLYIYLKNKNGGVLKPEYRLPCMIPGTLFLPIGLLITGWTAQNKVFWVAPDVGLIFVGAGVILNFQTIQTYIIDSFTLYAASALAAVSFLRSLAGFGFPLFAPTMYASLGFGKGNTILAVVAVVIGCPAPWFLLKHGERIRTSSKHAKKP